MYSIIYLLNVKTYMNMKQIIIKKSHKHAVILLAIPVIKWMRLYYVFWTLNSIMNQIIYKAAKSSCSHWVIRIKDILLIIGIFLFIIIIIVVV